MGNKWVKIPLLKLTSHYICFRLNIYARPYICSLGKPPCMEIHAGCDFNGGDFEEIQGIGSWEICADLCRDNAKCLYFSYNKAPKTCLLKAWMTL